MLIRTTALFAIAFAARADFSYTMTQKTTGGSMAAMAGKAADRVTKYYLKGQKMATSSTDFGTIIDFDAQTVTTINSVQKGCSVKKFSDITGTDMSNADITVDVKETGQKKTINGFNSSETVIGMNMDMDMGGRGPSMKMRIELDLWVSPDVPGASDLKAFYQKNAANFPWKSLAGSGNASIDRALAQIQRKMADMNGVVVENTIRVSPAAGSQMAMPQMPQVSPAQAAQMQAAMAKMQEMAKQGGPQAAAAQQAMGRMGAMSGGAPAATGGASGSLIEITADAGDFSTAGVPDSAFAIPAGYKCTQ